MNLSFIVYDAVILAVLFLFAFWGMHRGMVRTLCSLVAVLIAFGGASFAARLLAPPIASLLEPPITSAIEEHLEEAIQSAAFSYPELNGISMDQIPLSGVLEILEKTGLHGTLIDLVRTSVEKDVSGAASSAAAQVGAVVAHWLAYLLAYLLSFVLIMILWHVVSRALNLATRLPVLRTLNKAGGFALGALRGAVVLFVCVWLLYWFGSTGKSLLPPEATEQTHLLRFFIVNNPLNLLGKL